MHGGFIYYKKIITDKLTGIDKKVLSQVENFNNNGLDCRIYTMDTKQRNYIERLYNKILSIFPYSNTLPRWRFIDEFSDIDYLYLRRPAAYTVHMIKTLEKIKLRNPKIKIVLEIPTYPYDKELLINWKYYALYLKDIYNRKKLVQVVDRIAVQNNIKEIFGIRTLKFTNGIKVNDVKVRTPNEMNIDKINICAVASLEPWDGYERILKGLKKYLEKGGTRQINVHIVGEGKERKYYERLVKDFEIDSNVIFYGRKTGQELSDIYDLCDLALDVFGMYKKNNSIATSLKSREYLAKGLPMIIGCDVDIINEDFPYYLKYPNDDSEIDFQRIVDFYDRIYKDTNTKSQVAEKIRDYAYQVCDISNSMSEIIDFIKE
ncbi:MAG TPA: glycosyltransferase [Patescibacteria group bacterium]|nr:glycosyltransferase [Patescibacteria group bacterium]